MKITTSVLFILSLLLGCKEKTSSEGPAIVTGNLTNYVEDEVEFSHREYKLFSSQIKKKVSVNPDGSFKMKVDLDTPTKGFFSFGRKPATYEIEVETPSGEDSTFTRGTNSFQLVYLYLQPGDSVHMTVNVNNISQSLTFSGNNTADNRFVNVENEKFNSYPDKVRNNSYNIVTWGPEKYSSIIDNQKKEKLQFLQNYASEHNISEHLKEAYKWDYHGDAASSKIYYKSKREGFTNETVTLPTDYYNFMDAVPLADTFSDKGIGYFYFLDGFLEKKYELQNKEDVGGRAQFYKFVKNTIEDKPAYEYLAFKLGRDFNRVLYDEFGEHCPYPQLASKVRENYEHLEGMLPGSPAPEVTLSNLQDETQPLSSFQGTNIYIDFWATWCKPCIKEIPYLHKLKKEYKDDNIEFVSISFDSEQDKGKWKEFVKERDLSGPQFWVDEENNQKFSNAFNIQMIPRFVLIDEDGKIVDAKAPRPSETQKVRKLIDSELQNSK